MKKLIYTLCLFTGMAISSCEDWLARDPLDQIADVNLTYTADECKLYVNQFYTSFWGSPNNYICLLYTSDGAVDRSLLRKRDIKPLKENVR